MNTLWHWLKRTDRLLGRGLKGICIVLTAVLFFLLLLNVASRFIGFFSFGWFDEIVELCFAYLVFLGAAALWREREHFRLEFLEEKIRRRKILFGGFKLLIDGLALVFFLLLFVYGWKITARAMDTTPIFKMPKKALYLCVPLSGGLMSLYALRDLAVNFVDILIRGVWDGRES